MVVRCELLDGLEAVEALAPQWDALAVDAGRPYGAPGWALAWWRHVAPRDAALRVLVARAGDEVVGVAPFYATPWRGGVHAYALMGGDVAAPVEPLARPDAIEPVARSFTRALAAASPRPGLIRLAGTPADSPWPALLSEGWGSRRCWSYFEPPVPAPRVTLAAAETDEWLRSRSSNFRQQMRRARRKLDGERAVFRSSSTAAELERDLAEFRRLHESRWSWRGGSTSLVPGVDSMLVDAGRALLPEGRFRLASIEVDGHAISSLLFVSAGREVAYWNGGFDVAWERCKPSLVGLVEAVGAGLEAGAEHLDLGPGGQEYKYRFSDSVSNLRAVTLVPPGRTYAVGRLLFAPRQARVALSARLSESQKVRLRAITRIGR